MLRSILAVVIGYVAMAAVVVTGFALAFVAPTFAFHPGTVDVTTGWIVYTLMLSLVAAIVGGYVCRKIAKSKQPVVVFAILAGFVGLGSAVQNANREPTTKSAAELAKMSMHDRAQEARQPTAYAFALPLVAVAGILAGGTCCRKGCSE